MREFIAVSFLILSFTISAVPQKPGDEVQKRLKGHVVLLASEKFEGRRTGSAGATEAAGYLARQFAKSKLTPGIIRADGKRDYLQGFSHGKPSEQPQMGYNVVGILEGRDKILKREAIVIGAHYDHLGRGGESSLAAGSTDIHFGADDNASGTAAILELAREFAKEKKNKRTLIFIAFSGEESGLFGSKHYLNNPSFPVENTVAMINLDMVGRLNNEKLTIGGMGTAAEWRPLIERLNGIDAHGKEKRSGPSAPNPKRFELALNDDGFGPSDHASFYMQKIPVLFFFTGTHLDYHKPSDTAEKINVDGLAKIVEYVGDLVRTVDVSSVRPTYAVAKSTSPTGGRTGFNISLGTIPSYTESADGMVIDGVRDGSPAGKSGLKANDKIVRLAGMDVKNVQDYMKALGEMKPDVEYEIVVVRGSEKLTMKIVPVKRS